MPTVPSREDKPAITDSEIVKEAQERFRIANEAEGDNRARGVAALEFRDGQQWPDDLYNQRKIDKRPSLTINHTNTFVRRVVNNMRQQRPRIKVHPVGDGADVDKANLIAGIIRHIENISNASVAYDTGGESAVTIGWGYWRVLSDWCDVDSFDQELKIEQIRNALTVYLDPAATLPTGEDADWCLITFKMKREDYKRKYPNADNTEFIPSGNGDNLADWETKEEIRLAEYYRIKRTNDTLTQMSNGMCLFPSQIKDLQPQLTAAKVTPTKITRKSVRTSVEWFQLNGTEIVDRRCEGSNPLPDKWIPVIRCEGNVLDLNGRVRRKGMVADLMDPARMYNYWRTMETELLALAPKAPFIVAAGQLDGHPEWKDANQKPYSALVYEPAFVEQPDGSKQVLPPPIRQQPVAVPAGAVQAAQGAQQDLMSVAGMPHEPSADVPGAAISGVALQRRQALSDIGHFQYYDNQTRAISHTGRILLSLIPHYYSAPRMQRIVGEDGMPSMEAINQQVAGEIKNDMTVGRYDVVMDTGPGYETKRQEGAASMVELLNTKLAEQISHVGADLIVRNMDFAGADELANRLMPTTPQGMQDAMKNIPKQAQGVVQALQGQIQQLTQQLQHAQIELKFKTSIEQGWMGVEREKMKAKELDSRRADHTKQLDTHIRATTAHDVAEIQAGAQLLNTHVEAAHESVARQETLAAAAKAESRAN